MYSLQEISVKRFHLFKEATLPLRSGVTLIAGENYSGKSLLVSAIPTMLSLTNKNDFEPPPKNSHLEMKYLKDETAVDFSVTVHSSAKYNIGLNGNPQLPHKKSDAQRVMLRNWKIPQALFESTIFLRSVDKHALSTGTPGSRSTWLSEALELTTIYDEYKNQVDEKLKHLGKLADKKEVLEEEREKTLSRLPDSKISKAKAEKAKRLLSVHRKIAKKLPLRKQKLENIIQVIEKLESLPDISHPASYYERKLKDARAEYVRLTVEIDKEEAGAENRAANKKARSKMAELAPLVEGMTVKKNRKLLDKIEAAEKEVKQYLADKEKYDEQDEIRSALRSFEGKQILSTHLEEAENLLSALVYRSTKNEDLLESLQSLGPSATDCPTCGNTLTKGHVKQEIKRIEKELSSLPEEVTDAKGEVRYWKLRANRLAKRPSKPSFTSKDLSKWKAQAEAFDDYQTLKGSLKPEYKSDEKNLATKFKQARKDLDRLELRAKAASKQTAYRDMLPEELQELSMEELITIKIGHEDSLAKIKEKLAHSGDIVRKYSEIEIQYDTQQRVMANHRSTINRLTAEIGELEEELKDLPAWKANALAFGNSGVRLYDLRNSAATLSAKLTEMSALFFDSTYHFNIEVAPHKLNVMVERNGKVGSLKTLSGAETRCWNLLCAMALIRNLPSHLRCDIIFLDEIEANMNKRSRERYVRDVLPELATIIDKIVVLTPLMNGELNVPSDYSYMVHKQRKGDEWVSKLIEN